MPVWQTQGPPLRFDQSLSLGTSQPPAGLPRDGAGLTQAKAALPIRVPRPPGRPPADRYKFWSRSRSKIRSQGLPLRFVQTDRPVTSKASVGCRSYSIHSQKWMSVTCVALSRPHSASIGRFGRPVPFGYRQQCSTGTAAASMTSAQAGPYAARLLPLLIGESITLRSNYIARLISALSACTTPNVGHVTC